MENPEQIIQNTERENLIVTDNDLFNLKEAGKWASFLAVLGFIATGFFAVALLIMLIVNVFVAFFYLLLGGVYFFISMYLFKFGKFSKKVYLSKSKSDFSESLAFLNKFFTTSGIITIIVLVIYVLALVGILVGMMTLPVFNMNAL